MGKTFLFNPESSILEWKMETAQQNEDFHSLKLISSQFTEFHDSCPMGYVIRDQFYIIINDNMTIAVRYFQDREFWPIKSVNLEDHTIDEFLDQQVHLNPFKREIMSPFLTNILHEIEKCSDKNNQISSESLTTIIREALKTDALNAKKDREIYDEL